MGRARLLAVVAVVSLVACREGTVRVAYHPAPGDREAYEVRVRSVTVIDLDGEAPARSEDETVVEAVHTVLDAGPRGGVRVRVELRRRGSDARTYVVRLDRAAQLASVETIEGLPSEALGDLGLTEIFPAAAGAPPDRALAPGDRWRIDEPVELPGTARARLVGEGRLVELGLRGGREVAEVQSTTRLPVRRETALRRGRLLLTGTQVTESTARHDLDDGAVDSATSITRGSFRVRLLPPADVGGPPVNGRLTVEVRSEVERRD